MSLSDRFKTEVTRLLGKANVSFETITPSETTSPELRTVLGRICPKNRDEVVAVMKLANAHMVPIYPISTGRNWGYGDITPPKDGAVLLDLGRMNRIVSVDEKLAYAVVEPGVTQGQLYQYIQDRGLKLWLDSTGAGPDGGIVGNVLERGFGHTPYGDRFLSVSGLEVVLPQGEILRTGFGRYEQSEVTHLYPYGVGPILDGLFSQSGFGVVTQMGLWLMPQPEYFCAVVVMLEHPDDISHLIDRLRPLRLDGTLRSIVHIGNDLRLISGRQRYPYDQLDGGTALPPEMRADIRRTYGLKAWAMSAGFYGDKAQVRASISKLKKAVRGLSTKVTVVDEKLLSLGRRLSNMLPASALAKRLQDMVFEGEQAIGLLQGRPTRHFLAGAYWRNRRSTSSEEFGWNPARDGCGLLWLAPVIPSMGEHAIRLVTLAETILNRYGFDCPMTYSMVTDRALAGIITINYDRDNPAECQAAIECYREATKAFINAGYPPYRLSSTLMDAAITDPDTPYWQTVSALKQALDPSTILSPGRYQK